MRLRARIRSLRFAAVLASIVVLAGSADRLWAQDLSDELSELLTRASTALRQQQWLQAEQQLKTAYEKNSEAPEVLLAFAEFSERKGGRDLLALAWYRAYLAARPDAGNREEIKKRIEALEQRAMASANGLIEKALSAASNVAASDRPNALLTIARAQAKLGNVSGAFSTASSVRSAAGAVYYGSDPFGSVAEVLASQGDLRNVEQAIQRVESTKRSEALRLVVYALTSQKRIAEATAFAAPTTGIDRIISYGYIAKAQAEAGDRNGARSSVNTAVEALNRLDQSNRRGYILSLVDTASEAGEIETAKRLLADGTKLYNLNDRNEYHSVNSARWHLAKNLIKWRRLAEAEAIMPSVFANNKDPSFAWYRPNVLSDFAETHESRTREFIKQNKLSEAEAALGKEPWPGAFSKARLALANAHMERKDMAAARRVLDLAAAGLSGTSIADFGSPFGYALFRTYMSAAYNRLGDLAASRRILDATAATIVKVTDPERKKDPLQYTAEAYASLARAALAAKNAPAAKSAAAEIFKLANQFPAAGDRASALAKLRDIDPEIGITNELASALPSLPDGDSKQNIIKTLVKTYLFSRQDSDALAMAGRLNDLADRKTLLMEAINKRTDAKNWAGALALASAPGISDRLHAEIARKMLSIDMVKEAAALESKFTGPSEEADGYFYQLASLQGNSNDVEAALKTALRITSIPRRIDSLLALALTVYRTSGRMPARAIVERATGQFAQLKSPLDRARTCNSIRSYFAYGSVLHDELPASAGRPNDGVLGQACAADALEIPSQSDRADQLRDVISSYYETVTVRPIMSSAAVPRRRAVSRLIGEGVGLSSSYARESAVTAAFGAFARDGAVESALNLMAFPHGGSSSVIKTAVDWLVETGDTTAARRILDDYVAAISAFKDDSSRNSRHADAVDFAIALGDFDSAFKLVSEIKSAYLRTYRFNAIAEAAISRERFDVALNALERSKISAKEDGSTNFSKILASIAARAGDKNAESFIADVARTLKVDDEVDARSTLIRELLKWKQFDRARALLPEQEAALGRMTTAERERYSYYDSYFAGFLGQLGDTARLDKLIASVSLPERKIGLLITAVNGFIVAERTDAARVAIGRALELVNGIAEPVSKATHLQSIVSAYNNVGDAERARAVLGKVIELVADMPSPGAKASRLQSVADEYVRIGDINSARAAFARYLEVLQIKRTDFEAWADFRIAIARDGKDPEDATRRALAITDAYWRTVAAQTLVNMRINAKRFPSAIEIVKSMQPSPLLDLPVMKLVRFSLGKRDMDTARALIGQISHGGLRDDARRQMLLFQARQGGAEAAFADINIIEDRASRAYTLVDLGWMLAVKSDDPRSQSAYFAQLSFFVATKLAAEVPDLETKVDILASAAHGQNMLDPDVGATTLQRAETLAADIADARVRTYAVRWAKRSGAGAAPDPFASEERSAMSYLARRDGDRYRDVEAFLQSLATKNPTERINELANAAAEYGDFLREIRKNLADFEAKRKSALVR